MITSPSGRLYIGSTININTRFRKYKRYHCKGQCKLYNSFKKYGVENHIFEIVMETTIEEMYKYETLIGWGFNVLEEENLNLELPKLGDIWCCTNQETRDKRSLANKGNKNMLGKKHSKETKLKMSKSSKGKSKSIEHRNKISIVQKGKILSQEVRNNIGKGHFKPIYQYSLDGSFIKEWESKKEASQTLNINRDSISSCATGRQKTAGKYKWKYKN